MNKTDERYTGRLSFAWILILIILPLSVAIVSMCIGRISVPIGDVLHSLSAKVGLSEALSAPMEIVLWNIRFPRVILALLVGAGLSVAGCAFQSLFSNPLATPDTLGVASGASFGAALGILIGFNLVGIQIMAMLAGVGAVALTLLSAVGKTKKLNSVVLAGIMIGSLFNALISLVKYTADSETKLPSITYWLMGSMSSAGYSSLALGAPPIIIGIVILILLRWKLNILPLSEDEARSLGSNIKALRIVVIVCATVITASCVSMCGQVGWIGLLIPHMCRMVFGNNHMRLLPASVSFGAAFMVIVDTFARSISASELPISILTAIVGAPFFIILMRRFGGWEL